MTAPLLFDFHLAHLNDLEQVPFRKRLARLPAPLNQHVLDEYNSAVGRGMQFRNRWGWLEYLIRKAQAGEFIPTADLVERRRVHAVAAVIEPNPAGPVRVVSPIWSAHREDLRTRLTAGDFGTYVMPLRGIEEGNRLWLEAPNPYIVDWVTAHWGLFEAVLNPHTSLQLGVRVEVA